MDFHDVHAERGSVASPSMKPRWTTILAVSALASTGCSTTTYYAASSHVTHRVNKERDAGDDVRTVEPDAPTLLRSGATIAFFPPDSCVTTTAAASGSEEKEALIKMQCGVLMSGLEKAAAVEGYRVVSWHLLGGKGGGGGSALSMARELKVDVLFEVDQLTVQARDTGSTRKQDILFSQLDPGEDPKPLSLDDANDVAARCARVFGRSAKSEKTESGTLAVKMVGVADGHAKWFFRRTVSDAAKSEETDERFYKSTGGATSVGGWLLFAGGLVVGTTLLVVGGNKEGQTKGDGVPFFLVGGLLTAGGIAAPFLFRKKAPPPEKVICTASGATSDPRAGVARPKAESADDVDDDNRGSNRVATIDETGGARDAERDRHEKLVTAVVGEFTKELKALAAVRSSEPHPSAAATEAPPQFRPTPPSPLPPNAQIKQ
jgi:hypothetical protein